MRLLADMGISMRVVEALRTDGHDVVHAQDIDLGRASDREILEHAAADTRTVVTFDLDFAEIVALRQSDRERVVLLRLQNTRNENVLARLAGADRVRRRTRFRGHRGCRGRPLSRSCASNEASSWLAIER